MNREAAGADRLEPGLAHRHPILFAELLDLDRATAEAGQKRDVVGGRMMLEIGMDQPIVRLGQVGLIGDQHRRVRDTGE